MLSLRDKLASAKAKYQLPRPSRLVARKASEATLYLYDEIGPDDGYSSCVGAKTFVAALAECKGCSTLTLRINSPGGSIFEALAIMANLKEFPGHKVAVVDGLCASAATFLACGGCDEIRTAPESTWMIHNGLALAYGNAAELRKMADILDQKSADMVAIYERKTGQDAATLRSWMDAETWMSASEAVERRFADSIVETNSKETAPLSGNSQRLAGINGRIALARLALALPGERNEPAKKGNGRAQSGTVD